MLAIDKTSAQLKVGILLVILCFCGLIPTYSAQADNDLQVIMLHNGFNEVHFDGLNYKTLIVVAHRENYNAHSYDVATMYVDYKPADKYETPGLQIIPIFKKNADSILNLFRSGGADCMLEDFRIVNDSKTLGTWLILADRQFGRTYDDTEKVTFTYYKLTFDTDQMSGLPPFAFVYWKTVQAKKKYCDVNDAFEQELGLEAYRTDLEDQ